MPLPVLRPPPLALGLAVIALGAGFACQRNAPTAPAAAPAASPPVSSASAGVPESVQRVMGRWVRVDGGYVLALQQPERSGVVQATYLNPKPIKVSRAIWMQGATGLQIVVELNDVGYPGATYVLTHDPATDRLAGEYRQPAMQQSFQIEFIRQSAPPLR